MNMEYNHGFTTVLYMVGSTLKAGLFLMPSAFHQLGIPIAIVCTFVINAISFFSIYAMGLACRQLQANDKVTPQKIESIELPTTGNGLDMPSAAYIFDETAEDTSISYGLLTKRLGKWVSMGTNTILILSMLLIIFNCIRNIVTIPYNFLVGFDVFSNLFDKSTNIGGYYMYTIVVLLPMAIPYYKILWRNSSFVLTVFESISVTITLAALGFMIIYGTVNPVDYSVLSKFPTDGVLTALEHMVLASYCQFGFPIIYNGIKDKSISNMRNLIIIAFLLTCILYCFVGLFGYMGMGPEIAGLSLNTAILSKDSPVIQSLIGRYGAILGGYVPKIICLLYSIVFFTESILCLKVIVPIFNEQFSVFKLKESLSKKLVLILTIAIVVSSPLLLFGHLIRFFEIISYMIDPCICYVLPAFFALALVKTKKRLASCFVALAIFGLIMIPIFPVINLVYSRLNAKIMTTILNNTNSSTGIGETTYNYVANDLNETMYFY